MKTILRRTRGILGMGLTWSVAWAFTGAIFAVVESYWLDVDWTWLTEIILASSFSWATYGFALGTLFACVLAVAERRRGLEQLATWRVAVWGGIAGIILPVGFIIGLRAMAGGVHITNGFVATMLSMSLGAGCAAASLRLARAGSAVDSANQLGNRLTSQHTRQPWR